MRTDSTPPFRRVPSYDDVTPYLDHYFNYPAIPGEMTRQEFEAEFDHAHDVLIRHLQTVGTASEDSTEKVDFHLNRWVDVRRAINVVSDKFSPEVIFAIQRAQQELPTAYVINLDSHPAYVCILPYGEALGFADDDKASGILDAYGFPP